jgi:hypothetical protein
MNIKTDCGFLYWLRDLRTMQHYQVYRVFYKIMYMQKIILLTMLMIPGFLSFSQDHTAAQDKDAVARDAKGFHAIEVGGGIDLYLTPGDEETVAVSTSDLRVRDHIRTDVENGVLKIYLDNRNGRWNTHSKMKAYVSFKQMNAIEASGGSEVYVQGVLKGDRLDIRLSGGGSLKGKMDVSDLSVNQSGGSNVDVTGTVANLEVETSGGGNFKGYDLVADIGHFSTSGGGHIHATVNKELFVVASGGGGVYYKGTGVVRAVSASGGSEVQKKG